MWRSTERKRTVMTNKKAPLPARMYHTLPPSVKTVLHRCLTVTDLGLSLKFHYGEGNALREKGWYESERRGAVVDNDGDPLPWYTYPAIDFLERRLSADMQVFEYGGGNSTRWYASRVGRVTAVDDDPEWVDRVGPTLPSNGEIRYREQGRTYVEAITEVNDVDVIVIDGPYREDCIRPAMAALSDSGVIIRDDYHRVDDGTTDEFEPLFDAGFQVLPFYGLKPLNAHYRCTAIFYRNENCFGI